MKKLLLPIFILVTAYFFIQDNLNLRTPPEYKNIKIETRKSIIGESSNEKFYFAQVHPDDEEKLALEGFPKSGIYDRLTKRFLAPFPYAPLLPLSRFEVLNDETHVIFFNFLVNDLSDNGLTIFENGKIKFFYKVNQFCKRLRRDTYSDQNEHLWANYSLNPDNKSSEILISTSCDKTFSINYFTGKLQLIKSSNLTSMSDNKKDFLIFLSIIVVLSILTLLSFRLKTKFLTYSIVTIYSFLLFYLGQKLIYYGYHVYDEIMVYFLS
ncbi:MAG: hypothetical protein H7281_15215 [Bacteriovorax sp.]|nr:hypothetical protein [Bacteriovorax sp.]